MLWKLLSKNISGWQLSGYALAATVGLAILMIAVQFYSDLSASWSNDDGDIELVPPRNMVISKQVSMMSTLSGGAPSFSGDEIDEIARQPWCNGVSAFRAADFSVWLSVDMGGRGLQTAMFFESVPDSLVDISSRLWKFDEANPMVPIVLSKDYISLYNFGFASSGRMPVLSENTITQLPLQVMLAGNGNRRVLPARIVGFSSWLNTIAVPEAFMDWAHLRFGSGAEAQPSRLIVGVTDPGDPAIDRFITSNDYQVAGPDDNSGRAGFILRIVSTVVGIVGLLITVLALFILVLSLYLLVNKNRRTIVGLIRIGYSPRQVARPYQYLIVVINISATVLAVIATMIARNLWFESVVSDGISASVWPTIAIGGGIMLVVTIYNICVVRGLTHE